MAITTFKKNGKGNPTRAKYCIVALGNLDPHTWSKQDCFAPVSSQLELIKGSFITIALFNSPVFEWNRIKNSFMNANQVK